MEIVIYAEQFRYGNWGVWEHTCSPKEVDAVVNSALNRANGRSLNGKPVHDDFLEGARHLFNVSRGSAIAPKDGDTRVYCVCVDHLVIGVYEKIRQYSHRLASARQLAEVPLGISA